MHRTGFLITALVASLFAFTNLTFTPDSISFGEFTTTTGSFSAVGDTAHIFLFIDDNGDNAFTVGQDMLIYNSETNNEPFIDGGSPDDTIADGLMSLKLGAGWDEGEAFPFPGKYLMIVKDKGGADTAQMVLKPQTPTNTSVSGTVTGPQGNLKNILVFVEVSPDEPGETEVMGRSDTAGKFLIYLPDTTQGKKCLVGAEDEFDVLGTTMLVPPAEIETTVVANMSQLSFVFTEAKQFIKGTVKDIDGAVMSDVRLGFYNRDQGTEVRAESDSLGNYFAPITPGKWHSWLDDRGEKPFLSQNMEFEIKEDEDTTTKDFVLIVADTAITGKIIDSAHINLQEDFWLSVTLDITGTWSGNHSDYFNSYGDIDKDGNFKIATSSKYARYMFYAGSDELPSGFYVDPSRIDSVAPWQSDLVVWIKKGEQKINLTVVNEGGVALDSTTLELREHNSNNGIEVETDATGKASAVVYPAEWQVKLLDKDFLTMDFAVKIEQTDTTVDTTFVAHTTNSTITGRFEGAFQKIGDKLILMAGTQDSLQNYYTSEATIEQSGTFSINVSNAAYFGSYAMLIGNHNIPPGFVIVPKGDYHSVSAGDTGLVFTVYESKGSISGKFTMTLPQEYYMAGVVAIDSVNNIFLKGHIQKDSTYFIAAPNGTYTILGGYWGKTDTLVHRMDSVKVNDNQVVINVSNDGLNMIPINHIPLVETFSFGLRSWPNPFRGQTRILFTSPLSGNATLTLFDINGRALKTLYSGAVTKGMYTIFLDANTLGQKLKSGHLLARLEIIGTSNYRKTIKLLHVK